MKKYFGNIEVETLENENFRKVVWTGEHSQLVLMSIPVGGEIGEEVHQGVDQFFRVEDGEGKAIVEGEEVGLVDGSALVVPAGSKHNIFNTGSEPLKLYTIYSPANHIDGRVHTTREDAIADVEDEEFGHQKH
jgi:mannose-6-phosphate isomerase-like protein (cupin superfamily)